MQIYENDMLYLHIQTYFHGPEVSSGSFGGRYSLGGGYGVAAICGLLNFAFSKGVLTDISCDS